MNETDGLDTVMPDCVPHAKGKHNVWMADL